MTKLKTIPRGYVRCGLCGQAYPFRQQHTCEATRPSPLDNSNGNGAADPSTPPKFTTPFKVH